MGVLWGLDTPLPGSEARPWFLAEPSCSLVPTRAAPPRSLGRDE